MQNPMSFIFWTQQTGLPENRRYFYVFSQKLTHIFPSIIYLVQCDAVCVYYVFLSHSPSSPTPQERPQSYTSTRRIIIIIFLFLFGNFFLPARPNIPPAQDGNNNNNALLGGGGLGDFMAWKKRDTVSPRN